MNLQIAHYFRLRQLTGFFLKLWHYQVAKLIIVRFQGFIAFNPCIKASMLYADAFKLPPPVMDDRDR